VSIKNGLPGRLKILRIGKHVIGENHPCLIIAEAACEHKGSLRTAKKMARAAKKAGADIVKFQLHLPETEMIPKVVRFWAGSMEEVLKKVNLSLDDHRKLMHYCKSIGITYLCTAYCPAGIDVLQDLGVEAFKIGSGEMTNLPMIRKVAKISAKTGKAVLVSTGMSTLDEVVETAGVLQEEGAHFMLFNCTSEYPPKYEHLNLGLMEILRNRFKVQVGHSDHTPENYAAFAAVALGAKAVEKHFTLDRKDRGPDWRVSLEPKELQALVEGIRKIEAACGTQKKLHREEQPVRHWAHHSVVSLCDITAGSTITPEMVGVKRPGWGVPAKFLEKFYGSVAVKEISANTLLRWEDVRS